MQNDTPLPKIRLFVKDKIESSGQILLTQKQIHYLLNVMRCKDGQECLIFNGLDGEWLAKIDVLSKKSCSVRPVMNIRQQTSDKKLYLCFAPVKNAPIANLVQKATELGVTELYPIITKHTIVNRINVDRLEANCIEAAEQCNRLSVPKIHNVELLMDFLDNWNPSIQLILCDETGGGDNIYYALMELNKQPSAILIGPEGGFAKSELDLIKKKPYVTSIGMGPRILRADTAAIAAISCYQSVLGDWDEKPSFNKGYKNDET